MSFQSGSHMFFQCTGVRTDPAQGTSLWNFKVKKLLLYTASTILIPRSPSQELQRIQYSKAKRQEEEKEDPWTRWPSSEQTHREFPGWGGTTTYEDGGASEVSSSLIWIRCVQPRRPWQRSLQSEKIPEACEHAGRKFRQLVQSPIQNEKMK